MGKFPKTRSCPLFRGFTVYLRPYTVATHGNRRRVFQKKNYFNEKKFGEIKVINIKFKNLNLRKKMNSAAGMFHRIYFGVN